jgi:hypothetical protein
VSAAASHRCRPAVARIEHLEGLSDEELALIAAGE